jgi:hypothetical protein
MSSNTANNLNIMNSNISTTISKIKENKFLSTAIIVFVLIFVIYMLYSMQRDFSSVALDSPYIVPTTILARKPKSFPAEKILPSVDQKYGIEFSYTLWLFIDDTTYNSSTKQKHIFHKGDPNGNPLQCPGVWLAPDRNMIEINLNTYEKVSEKCQIGNIPLNKWFCLCIVVINNNVDIYINNNLKKRCKLEGLPKQNYGKVYIARDDGFDGFISKLRYWNYALPYYKIEQVFADGPSDAPCVDTGVLPPYLAPNYWMQTGFPDVVQSS